MSRPEDPRDGVGSLVKILAVVAAVLVLSTIPIAAGQIGNSPEVVSSPEVPEVCLEALDLNNEFFKVYDSTILDFPTLSEIMFFSIDAAHEGNEQYLENLYEDAQELTQKSEEAYSQIYKLIEPMERAEQACRALSQSANH